MKIEIIDESGIIILKIRDRIDMVSCIELNKVLDSAFNRKNYLIGVDLNKVSYIDSFAVGVFVRHWNKLQRAGGALVFYNVGDMVRKTMVQAELHDYFELFASREEAATALQNLKFPAAI